MWEAIEFICSVMQARNWSIYTTPFNARHTALPTKGGFTSPILKWLDPLSRHLFQVWSRLPSLSNLLASSRHPRHSATSFILHGCWFMWLGWGSSVEIQVSFWVSYATYETRMWLTFLFPPVRVTFTKRRVYCILFLARPLGVFFFSWGSTY
jgi:hypothetical protein